MRIVARMLLLARSMGLIPRELEANLTPNCEFQMWNVSNSGRLSCLLLSQFELYHKTMARPRHPSCNMKAQLDQMGAWLAKHKLRASKRVCHKQANANDGCTCNFASCLISKLVLFKRQRFSLFFLLSWLCGANDVLDRHCNFYFFWHRTKRAVRSAMALF